MPYRATNMVVGLVGVAVLVALVVLGMNVYRSARTGPRWKRALITAGLVMLGLAATNSCTRLTCYLPVNPDTAGRRQQESKTPLEKTPEWKVIQGAWEFAEPLAASGQSTKAQRKEADDKLNAAKAAVEKLAGSGLLNAAEAGLLTGEAESLRSDVYRGPASDWGLCYDMAVIPQVKTSLRRLSQRLPLLEQLTKEGQLGEPVLAKVLPTMEADVKTLTNEKELAKLQPKERAEAESLRPQVEKALSDLKQRMEKPK